MSCAIDCDNERHLFCHLPVSSAPAPARDGLPPVSLCTAKEGVWCVCVFVCVEGGGGVWLPFVVLCAC